MTNEQTLRGEITLYRRSLQRLADAVWEAVQRGHLNSRSAAADACLDAREILAEREPVESHLQTALDACQFVKDYLRKLEEGIPTDDPLYETRKRFHAPLHAKLDAALK